jgi:hypothetical protein
MIDASMNAREFIPTDPSERRRLWREWIHVDAPRNNAVVRRVPAPSVESPISNDWLPEVIDAPTGVIHGLKTAIAECLVGGTLPIVDRNRLISRSIKLGLTRFEANLLIAAVQNRHRASAEIDRSACETGRRSFPWGWLLAGAIAFETAIVWAICRLLL